MTHARTSLKTSFRATVPHIRHSLHLLLTYPGVGYYLGDKGAIHFSEIASPHQCFRVPPMGRIPPFENHCSKEQKPTTGIRKLSKMKTARTHRDPGSRALQASHLSRERNYLPAPGLMGVWTRQFQRQGWSDTKERKLLSCIRAYYRVMVAMRYGSISISKDGAHFWWESELRPLSHRDAINIHTVSSSSGCNR